MIKIYSLSDPITGEIRYVGKTNQSLDRRLNAHISEVRRGYCRTHKINWIKSLMNNNLLPTIDILEIATKDNWKKLEIYWISQLKSWGFNLTNMTDGGDGNNNQMFSKESTIKRSKSLIGHIVTEETRRKISRKQVGKKLRQETKDKLRLHNLGKRHEVSPQISRRTSGIQPFFIATS